MYLEATRDLLAEENRLLSMDFDLERGVQPATDGVVLPGTGIAARWMVLCQGYRSLANHWFDRLPLHPARGDILTIYSPSLKLDHVLHCDSWIVPLGEHRFLTGATYDRHALKTTETDAAASRYRRELSQRWEGATGQKIDGHGARILRHGIAVRPASYDRHPLLGAHPQFPTVLCLNGLGSKGSLMAPRLASHLLRFMLDKEGIETSLYWMRNRR
jgi:glycine/D-amino acid oxidase-like deaminating enzyme